MHDVDLKRQIENATKFTDFSELGANFQTLRRVEFYLCKSQCSPIH